MKNQGYERALVAKRREWVEKKAGSRLEHVGSYTIPAERMRGNIENPVGAAQIPLGIAGPLLIHGIHAQGIFYVPLATTEGALVRSYERGMMTLTKAGGVCVRVYVDENRVSPIVFFEDVAEAYEFARGLQDYFEMLRAEAESTTQHGKLLRVECQPLGRHVILTFCYFTCDAQGMNMIVRATERACKWILGHSRAKGFQIFSGLSSEKRASGILLNGGKGKKVTAGARIASEIVKAYVHASPEQMLDVWHHTVLGHMQAGATGYNAHYANGLAALYVACGQDVANVVNSAVGITNFEVTENRDLYASVTLPSLTVGTVGGGTGLGTSRECLELLGCAGRGNAVKFAEVVAATLLAGELSMAGAIASGEFVSAHESYGRNRPIEDSHEMAVRGSETKSVLL